MKPIQPYLSISMDKINILFVDDDPSLLASLKRTLHKKTHAWDMRFAESGQAALELLKENDADVIISDMRMPGMDGVELLAQVKKFSPNTVRFILSGYSDKQMILDSVGLTHQFFAKPCDPKILIQAINYSSTLYRHIGNPRIQQVVCGINSLPTPPEIYNKISTELNKIEPSIEYISKVVKQDSAISAKVLQLVNSAFFGIGRGISDIEEATVFLGIENLKSLVLVIGMINESFSSISHNFDIEAYSHHSFNVGFLSEKIARSMGKNPKECQTAFTAGLLHDIGKLVMATHFESSYSAVAAFAMHTPGTAQIQDMENDQFGINHAEIGAALVGIWGLPPTIVNAIAYHHKPRKEPEEDFSLSTLVHIANALVLHASSKESIFDSDLIDRAHIKSQELEEQVLNWLKNDF